MYQVTVQMLLGLYRPWSILAVTRVERLGGPRQTSVRQGPALAQHQAQEELEEQVGG